MSTFNLIQEKLTTLKYNINIEQCDHLADYSKLDIYVEEIPEINVE